MGVPATVKKTLVLLLLVTVLVTVFTFIKYATFTQGNNQECIERRLVQQHPQSESTKDNSATRLGHKNGSDNVPGDNSQQDTGGRGDIEPYIYTAKDVQAYKEKSGITKFPDCLIIGARKSGTGALLHFLGMHPDVVITEKEPQFFAQKPYYDQGLQYYHQALPVAQANQTLVEKSADYYHSRFDAPKRVHAFFNSSVKLILIVRDPVVRMCSDYVFMRDYPNMNYTEKTHSLAEMLLTPGGDINTNWGCIIRSMYERHVSKWLEYFPREQLHVMDGESFTYDNPGTELQKVEEFLGLKPYMTKDRFYFSEEKGFYCMQDYGCMGKGKGHKHSGKPLIAPELEAQAREYFKPHNQQFYNLVGVDFGWK